MHQLNQLLCLKSHLATNQPPSLIMVIVHGKFGIKKLPIFFTCLEQSPQFIVVKMFAKLAAAAHGFKNHERNLSPR